MNTDPAHFAAEHVMIMAAPNGARRSQADHPALPITPAELASNAAELRDAGVAVLHLHVRDEHGQHTLDAGRYREAIAAIRERVGNDLVLQVTTEAVGIYRSDQQLEVVKELRPEAVSLALREVCPPNGDVAAFTDFCRWMTDRGTWPQYILYSVEDIQHFDALRQRDVFSESAPAVLLVLGNYTEQRAGTVADLEQLLAAGSFDATPWAVCCFGPHEHDVMLAALERGGHVRIGFENNLQLSDGSIAEDNAALIRQFVAATSGHQRQPASAALVRSVFCGAANLTTSPRRGLPP